MRLFFLIYFSLAAALLLFTAFTNFNVTGYSYNFDEETRIVTIEDGFLKKKTYDMDTQENYSIQIIQDVMLPINQAGDLWAANILILPFFIAGLFGLFYSSLRQGKNFKWYVTGYMLILVLLIAWEINAYQDLFENLRSLTDYTNRLKG